MINITSERGIGHIEVKGTAQELIGDTAIIIKTIHDTSLGEIFTLPELLGIINSILLDDNLVPDGQHKKIENIIDKTGALQ